MADRFSICKLCCKKYQHNRSLRRHMVECHGAGPGKMADKLGSSICKDCDKKYQHNSSLRRHMIERHGAGPATNFSCREDGCSASFPTAHKLRSHLVNDHSLVFVDETQEFASIDDFQRWKEDLELTERTYFTQRGATNTETDSSRKYFYCNRSGSYTSRSKGKRMVRHSCRIGEFCTAYIAVKVNTKSGNVSVKFCKTHYKHDKELRHLHLSSSEKAWVAAQCAQKVNTNDILNKIRNSSQDSLERIHLITRKDIANIKRACSLQERSVKRHSDDRTSLMLCIEELKALGDQSPILYCKLQGDNHKNLPDGDVFLVIQSPLQQQMLKEFGGSIICLDATYGTNGDGFKLTSVLGVDEFGEGFPAAWCISSRDDFFTLREFFQVLCNKCGIIHSKWIMTDDAEQYFEAWVDVFGFGPKKQLCTWQMDRAWREKLNLIKDQQLQCDVYKILRFLLEERSEERFVELVEQVKKELMNEKATEAFGDYIRNTYLSRPKQWAFCHRLQMGLSMNCEALHSILNHIYTQGDTHKSLDRCVFMLLSLIKNKGIDRLMKLEAGQSTSKVAAIAERHQTSMKLSLECVEDKGDNRFGVATESEESEQYLVTFSTTPCKLSCTLSCSSCQVCVHTSFCTCTDSLIRGIICKHVHLACRYRNRAAVFEVDVPEIEMTESHEDLIPVITNIQSLQSSQDFSLESKKQKLLQQLSTLTHQIRISNPSDLDKVFSESEKHLNAVLNLVVQDTPLEVPVIPNALASKRQECAFSTKPKETRRQDNIVIPIPEGNTTVKNSIPNDTNLLTTGFIFIMPKHTST